MKTSVPRPPPDPASLKQMILDRRTAFGNYNVARLGELIRRLPEERRRAFETVPILLHLNAKGLPGHVDNPRTPHGIHRFSESAFWKIGKRHLEIEKETIRSVLLPRYYIRGVYLAGSAGTRAQTERSDLNFWLLVDSENMDETQRGLLFQKLEAIKAWARQEHDQAVTFLVPPLGRMRRNDRLGWGQPFTRIPRGGLLKEEFYRTFIRIAGQIPLWAVLPEGLNDEEYNGWTEAVRRLPESDADHRVEDYLDMGPPTPIDGGEYPGALLAEISRFREDPVRALIRSSLIAYHCLFLQEQGPLCEEIKQSFSLPRSDGEPADPAVRSFDAAERFFEDMEDRDGSDLIRKCIYLRLSGYPGPPLRERSDPNRDILGRFRRRWGWSRDQAKRIERVEEWTETERLGLEDRILETLWALLTRVSHAEAVERARGTGGVNDLAPLRSRLEERFAAKAGRIPHASAWLRAKRQSVAVHVKSLRGPTDTDRWAVCEQGTHASGEKEIVLFSDVRLLRVLGWIILNGLYNPRRSSVVFHQVHSTIAARRAEALIKSMEQFFRMEPSAGDLDAAPAWARLLVVLDIGLGPRQPHLSSADLLIRNTWGEMFHLPLDLGHLENNLLRCYEIAKVVRQYREQAPTGKFEFKIYHSSTIEDAQAEKNINEFIQSFHNDASGKPDL